MPLPLNVVIPVDMGSNIKEGSTVVGAPASDALHWVSTAKGTDNTVFYPLVAQSSDINNNTILGNDHMLTSPAFVKAYLASLLSALGGDGKVSGLSYNSVNRNLTITQTDGSVFSVPLTAAAATVEGMVKLLKAVNYPAGALDDTSAITAAFCQAMIDAAFATIPGVTTIRTMTYSSATRQLTLTDTAGTGFVATFPLATANIAGLALLATSVQYPAALGSDVLATTPLFVKNYVEAAIAALPADKYLQGLQSYNATTNIMTLLMNDGSTVNVDMNALMTDAVAEAIAANTYTASHGNVMVGKDVRSTLGDGSRLVLDGSTAPLTVDLINDRLDIADISDAGKNKEVAPAELLKAGITAGPGITVSVNPDGSVKVENAAIFGGISANAPLTGNGTAGAPLTVPAATDTAPGIVRLVTGANYPVAPADPEYVGGAVTPEMLDAWGAAHGGGDLLEWYAAPDTFIYNGEALTAAQAASFTGPPIEVGWWTAMVPVTGGARGKVRFSVVAGALPAGFILDTVSGLIYQNAGTVVGTATFTVQATDGAQTITRQFKMGVTLISTLAINFDHFQLNNPMYMRNCSGVVVKVGDNLDVLARLTASYMAPVMIDTGGGPTDYALVPCVPRDLMAGRADTIWLDRGPSAFAPSLVSGALPTGCVIRGSALPVQNGGYVGGIPTTPGYYEFVPLVGNANRSPKYFIKVNPATGAPLA